MGLRGRSFRGSLITATVLARPPFLVIRRAAALGLSIGRCMPRTKTPAALDIAGLVVTLVLGADLAIAVVIKAVARPAVGPVVIVVFARRCIAILGLRLLGLHLRRHDDTAVVLGMLQVVLRGDYVARGLGVPCQRKVLLRHMGGRTSNLHIRSVGFVAPRQRIRPLAASTA